MDVTHTRVTPERPPAGEGGFCDGCYTHTRVTPERPRGRGKGKGEGSTRKAAGHSYPKSGA